MLSKIDDNFNANEIEKVLFKEAEEICENDIEQCKKIGINGLEIIKKIYRKKEKLIFYAL